MAKRATGVMTEEWPERYTGSGFQNGGRKPPIKGCRSSLEVGKGKIKTKQRNDYSSELSSLLESPERNIALSLPWASNS